MGYLASPGYVHVLRICNKNMKSKNNFTWPSSGFVKCPDWNSESNCGNGLHGYLPDKLNLNVSNTKRGDPHRKFLVVKVKKSNLVSLGDKVKFKEGEIIYCGTLKDALNYFKPFEGPQVDSGSLVKSYYPAISNKEYGHAISDRVAISIKGDSFAECVSYYGIAVCLSRGGKVKGELGSRLILVNNYGVPYSARVGVKGIKENTWYKLSKNKFVEVK